jgi:uncharacterized membrane protein
MEDQVNAANPLDLHAALQNVKMPASTAAIVDAATVAGAPLSVMETLATLPDREWRSIDDVVAAATTGFRPNSDEPADPPDATGDSPPGGGSSTAGAATAAPSTAAVSGDDRNEADSPGGLDGSDDNPLLDAMDRIESERRLDSAINAVDRFVQPLRRGPARVALGGKWLGHALHPLLTDLPIGCWLSSALLDLTPGGSTRRASKRLVGAGIVFAVPTALSGASDWSVMSDQRGRRVGIVHAGLNTIALAFYAWSWNLRRRNHHWRGMLAGFVGGGTTIASGYLGGHLSFGLNTMPAPTDGTA